MLAFLNFFRDHVEKFAIKTKSLRSLLTKNGENDEEVLSSAREELGVLKKDLINNLPLRPIPTNCELKIHTDFSADDFGAAVYFQASSEMHFVLSRFMSRATRDAERRYAAIEGEAANIVWALGELNIELPIGYHYNRPQTSGRPSEAFRPRATTGTEA